MKVDLNAVCHPWLCDVMGHMTTRYYMAMFDDASYHFLYRVFGWSGSDTKTRDIGWADVKHTIEYQDEVHSGQLLEIAGKLTKLGGKSITVVYEMRDKNTQNIVATLESVSVLFDTHARKAMALPDDMRAQAQQVLISSS